MTFIQSSADACNFRIRSILGVVSLFVSKCELPLMSKRTPIAFFAYNRPDHAQRALEALSRCRNLEVCDLYLYSDGPRSDADALDVEATRKILRDWAGAFNARVVERPGNLGLAKSIVTGVSDLCEVYGRVIVVEDDLIVSPDFLHYMIQSLDHYENDAQVMQVGGFTLSPPAGVAYDAFLLPVTTTWGWATWQRAWQYFSWQPSDLDAAKQDKHWRRLFDMNGTCAFSAMLEDRMAGRNDSWGILWWYAVSRQNGLVVYPAKSLVWNGGFDGSGTHCGSGDFLGQGAPSDRLSVTLRDSLEFPADVRFESGHLFQLEEFFRARLSGDQSRPGGESARRRFKAVTRVLKEKLRNAIF